VRYFTEPRTLFDDARGRFYPPPNVDSADISLEIREKPPVAAADEKLLFSLIKSAFSQRRKTFINAAANGLSIDKAALAGILRKLGIDEQIRPEKLTLDDFAAISNYVTEN
jgi:16S rRNA (adenine1518-N6/adenine1519-N6)-dimethyltransferase